jgi:hypothetical protein
MALGPFTQTRFFGASIASISARVGWGSESSEITIDLVEDTCSGSRVDYDDEGNASSVTDSDAFRPPKLGQPGYFKFGSFSFGGIIKNWEYNDSATGGYTSTVRLTSPTEVLEAGNVILSGYDGGTQGIPNLFSAAAPLWCNDAGVTWAEITAVIHWQVFQLAGVSYILDVSEVPGYDYRFTGDSVNVLEAIDTAVKALGGRFYVDLIKSSLPDMPENSGFIKIRFVGVNETIESADLVDDAIDINPVDRLSQGLVTQFFGGSSCSSGLMHRSRGIELRNAITNSLLVGDSMQVLWGVDNATDETVDEDNFVAEGLIRQFWGLKENGDAIIGVGDGDDHNFDVDCSNLNVDIGVPTYNVTVREIRAAMHSFESWMAYMQFVKKDILKRALKAQGEDYEPILRTGETSGLRKLLTYVDTAKAADLDAASEPDDWLVQSAVGADRIEKAKNKGKWQGARVLHNFVQGFAEFYGKKFIVALPMIACCTDDNLNIKQSWEQTDGGWTESDVMGLAAGSAQLELFKLDDGRIGPVLKWTLNNAINRFDLDELAGQEFYAQNLQNVWVKAQFDQIINPCGGSPLGVVGVGGAVQKEEADDDIPLALPLAMWALLMDKENEARRWDWQNDDEARTEADAEAKYPDLDDGDHESILELVNRPGFDNIRGLGMAPPVYLPGSAVIPLKSNAKSYGPWFATTEGQISLGVAGKSDYERSTTFNPWTFGSTATMNSAALTHVSSKVSNQQVLESGSGTITAGPAVSSLGAQVINGGPSLTGIEMSVSPTGGYTTSYRMRTHIVDWGALARQRVEALERMGQNMRKMQRAFNQKVIGNNIIPSRLSHRFKADRRWESFRSSPDWVIMKNYIRDDDDTTKYGYGVSSTLFHAIAYLASDYGNTAAVKWPAILRPFSRTGPHNNLPTFIASPSTTLSGGSSPDYLGAQGNGNPPYYTLSPLPPTQYESHLPITITTTNPFASEASDIHSGSTSVGHDMLYISRSSVFPTPLNIFDGTYNTEVRAIGVRFPLVGVGWGYDSDGFPVPNKAFENNETYDSHQRQMQFADNWLSKPQDWKAGTLDVRWDERRGMWVCPPAFKLVHAQLRETLSAGLGYSATAEVVETEWENLADGVGVSTENEEIAVYAYFSLLRRSHV